jgi:imidazolonepropionase-like amidohydrolase
MLRRARIIVATILACLLNTFPALAQNQTAQAVLFQNVRVFDGLDDILSEPVDVLVRGEIIEQISSEPIETDDIVSLTIVAGDGRTLMPGLTDAHVHLVMSTIPIGVMMTADPNYVAVRAVVAAEDMLARGFTSVRDLGGPSFGLKRAIDEGVVPGPRIWPSGATISQTSGHGDFRTVMDLPRSDGAPLHFTERLGFAAIADGRPEMLRRVREQLMRGASQIKLMAGGGVASDYDPLDVTQFTEDEIRAAVEAAEDWGTYVTVHAYTPDAIQSAIAAGVRCIDHGRTKIPHA